MNGLPILTESMVQYRLDIYLEHIEEASYLYEQCLLLRNDPEITWKDLGDFEARLETHIDALVVGEDLALEVCRAQARNGDFGELHTALRVFCRQNRGDLVAELWSDCDPTDMDRAKAIFDALKDECPADWQNGLAPIFFEDFVNLIPVAAPVFGYRRYKSEAALLHALDKAPEPVLPCIIWALGRIGARDSQSVLIPLLDHTNHRIRKEAAESLLRYGNFEAVQQSLTCATLEDWPLTAVGLCGGRSAANLLSERVERGNADDDCLIALGLLGNLSAISALYSSLSDPALARAAATGLYLITGAEIYEEVFVPDEFDEDELFENEIEAYRNENNVPTKSDGEPYGEYIHRLSQNPEDWETWLLENQTRFNSNYRYRLGKHYCPACLLETLVSDASPYRARQLAIEELKIRYDADFAIEADMPVIDQERILSQIARWVQSNQARFEPGAWYFHGRLMSD